jgi:hypothetical protein
VTRRIEDLGIRPGQARSAALFLLTAEVPADILARAAAEAAAALMSGGT